MQTRKPLLFATIFVAFGSLSFAEEWTPPENPDPQVILREASADAQAKRYDVALAKHVWFHENALSLNPGMGGVRLSFALSDWERLGQEYPPAMDKLRGIRDALEEKAKQGEELSSGFHDLVANNRTLGEESRTADAFRSLDSLNPKAAKRAFHFVKPALVKDKAYELYVKYVDPKMDFLRMKQLYELNRQMAEDPKFGASIAEHGRRSFRNESATLVAILAVNDRKPEAEEIAALAKKELDDAQFHEELAKALSGTVPKPWP